MKILFVNIARVCMTMVYAVLKLLPTQRKVVFLSRQSNTPSCDIAMLEKRLHDDDPSVETVAICHRVGSGAAGARAFAPSVMSSMYHLATSRVCILESYWPAVSLLRHKPDLTVVQMWHALGKIKQSGLVTVGREGGRPAALSRAVRMHEGYDYVVAGAPAWNRFYCESFGCSEEQILNFGLPRMDCLRDGRDEMRKSFFERHPELSGKPIVLYAPTFRRNSSGAATQADVGRLASPDYHLVVKCHPNQAIDASDMPTCPDFTAMAMLPVADVLVTDYSAIALEAAWMGIETLYYLYDYDEYRAGNGLNLDIPAEMPSCVFYDADALAVAVERALAGGYPYREFEAYREKYVLPPDSQPTHDLAAFIESRL